MTSLLKLKNQHSKLRLKSNFICSIHQETVLVNKPLKQQDMWLQENQGQSKFLNLFKIWVNIMGIEQHRTLLIKIRINNPNLICIDRHWTLVRGVLTYGGSQKHVKPSNSSMGNHDPHF